jgi:hypothetical protein
MVAVVLAMAGDELGVEVRVRARWRTAMGLEIDRADERVVAADLPELLHPAERL